MKNKIKKYLKQLRFKLLKLLFTEDEKNLMIRAIETRVTMLYEIRIKEKWVNKEEMWEDITDLVKLKEIFSTKDWS